MTLIIGITSILIGILILLFSYSLELPLLALYFTSPMKNSNINRCSNCNWIKILTLVVASDTADKGILQYISLYELALYSVLIPLRSNLLLNSVSFVR